MKRTRTTKKTDAKNIENILVRAINDSHRGWVKGGLVPPPKELAIDWEKALSGVAKAEILASTFHLLCDHMPEVWKKVPSWLRAQIRQSMFDCSVDFRDLNKKDIENCIQYGEWLSLKHPAPKGTHKALSNLPKRS